MRSFFTAEESDALTEIFNIGAGKVALAMSELLDAPIAFTVPFCLVLPLVKATGYFQCRFGTKICIISQDFSGPFDGDALLMFHEESSLQLAKAELHTDEPIEVITEMEREALTEIGNIITQCLPEQRRRPSRARGGNLPAALRPPAPQVRSCTTHAAST